MNSRPHGTEMAEWEFEPKFISVLLPSPASMTPPVPVLTRSVRSSFFYWASPQLTAGIPLPLHPRCHSVLIQTVKETETMGKAV